MGRGEGVEGGGGRWEGVEGGGGGGKGWRGVKGGGGNSVQELDLFMRLTNESDGVADGDAVDSRVKENDPGTTGHNDPWTPDH